MIDLGQIEAAFFNVLEDLKDYLDDLALIGGWMSYIYSKFLWDNLAVKLVTTVDIDFGFPDTVVFCNRKITIRFNSCKENR